MRIHAIRPSLALGALALLVAALPASAANLLPHLEERGQATQLMVDGRPYLMLAGEATNTAASDPTFMERVWPRLARMHLNTVLVGLGWDWIEPTPGHFDFSLVDDALAGARKNHLHVVFLWFGSWKNGLSSFAPAWVKADEARYPRVRIKGGKAIEVLSTFSDANRDADARAYGALMRHLKEVDGSQHTVIMMQMENEVGVLGDSRDRSPAADAAFAGDVPAALMNYLEQHQDRLEPALVKLWQGAGEKSSGTWQQVFGSTPATDEIFMAWHYARYMNHVAAAGKAEYPLPVYTNTWIVQPGDNGPGDFPSGGPEPLVLDVWKAGAPSINLNAPDIYLPDFATWCARFHRYNNPLFVPESRGNPGDAYFVFGHHDGIGYSPFAIDVAGRFARPRPGGGAPVPTKPEDLPLPRAYAVLGRLAPVILQHQTTGTIDAVLLDKQHPTDHVKLGGYILNVGLRTNRRMPSLGASSGYGLFIAMGPDQFLVSGSDIQVTFTPNTPGPAIAGLARVEKGTYIDGRWKTERRMNGDDVLLDYKLAQAAAENQSGSGLRFGPGAPTIQRVWLYRYD